MTAELRNLPHIASMAFNEPLMLEPAYARVFFCALGRNRETAHAQVNLRTRLNAENLYQEIAEMLSKK